MRGLGYTLSKTASELLNRMTGAVHYFIRERLLVWLLAYSSAGLLIGYSAYHRSQEDLNDLLDYQLKLAFAAASKRWACGAGNAA
jgi:hypothetical protein